MKQLCLAVERPFVAFIVVLALTAISLLGIGHLRFNGDLLGALDRGTETGVALQEFEDRFPNRVGEEVFLIETQDFGDPENYRALEDLVFELLLTPGVASVASVFTVPNAEGRPFLEAAADSGLDEPDRISALLDSSPLAASLITVGRGETLIIVLPERDVPEAELLASLEEAFVLFDERLRVSPLGVRSLEREISRGLLKDQRILTPISLLVCLLVAAILLRSPRASLACGLPAVFGLLWFLGFLGLTGIEMTFFVALVPTVIVVLGLADAVHVYFAVQRSGAEAETAKDALSLGMDETVPAVILTTATSAIAFLSILVIGAPSLSQLAIAGGAGMALVLVSVLLVFPLSYRLFMGRKSARAPLPFYRALGFARDLRGAPGRGVLIGLALVAALFAIQRQSEVGFGYEENIPRTSYTREAFIRSRDAGLGTGSLFVILDDQDGVPGIGDADASRLRSLASTVYQVPESDAFSQVPSGLIAADELAYALPVPMTLGLGSVAVQDFAQELRERLADAGLGDVQVIGYPLLATTDIPPLIQDLRTAFYVALAFIAILAAVTLGSVRLAAVAVIPNILPIYFVEAALVIFQRSTTMSDTVALIVAFGIAVDNSVHFLNRFRLAQARSDAVGEALEDVTAPVSATTILLVAGFGATLFSVLPSVANFGVLVALALMAALAVVLFLLPSFLDWSET